MNRITESNIDYSEGVRHNKFVLFKKASAVYMKKRSSDNFNRLKKASKEFHKYNLIHMDKLNRFYKWGKQMNTEKLLPTSKLVDSIYKNNVNGITMNGHKDEADRRSKMNTEEITQAIVMHIYGAEVSDIANALDVNYLNVYHAVVRKAHRALK